MRVCLRLTVPKWKWIQNWTTQKFESKRSAETFRSVLKKKKKTQATMDNWATGHWQSLLLLLLLLLLLTRTYQLAVSLGTDSLLSVCVYVVILFFVFIPFSSYQIADYNWAHDAMWLSARVCICVWCGVHKVSQYMRAHATNENSHTHSHYRWKFSGESAHT